MHPKKWAEYQLCSPSQKQCFFKAALDAKPGVSYFEQPGVDKCEVHVEKSIFETIIEDLLYFTEDEDIEIEPARKKDIIGFEPIHNDNVEIECYIVTISNTFQYQVIIKTVGNGLSFRQAACVIKDLRDMTGLGCKIGNIS